MAQPGGQKGQLIPQLSGGTRLDFKGVLSNINYALLVLVWGPASAKPFQKGSVPVESVAWGFLSERFT